MIDQLKELSARAEEVRKQFVEEAKAKLQPAFLQIFADHPCIKAFGWTQYTPYFNDGEPCVFSVGSLQASSSDTRDEELYGEGWEEIFGNPEAGFTDEAWKTLTDLEAVLNSMEPVLLDAFGDHVQVIVTPQGVDVNEYSHD